MVHSKSLLAFVFVSAAFIAVSLAQAKADSNPCTVTSDGAGGWIVNCTSAIPPTVISPINTGTQYNGNDGGGGSTGAVVVSPGSGGDGDAGQSPTLDYFPLSVGSQAIEDFGIAPAAIFVQANGGNGGGGGDADACVCGGADGGSGGTGGNPTVTIEPTLALFTSGNAVPGVWVRSVGGIGGNGGDANGTSGSPGSGGAGGAGGNVTVNVYDNIITVGDQSVGIVAQSLGGGGGNSGGGILNTGSGNGGASQNGGTVTVNFGLLGNGSDEPGSIVTYGNNAIGILGQSVGGHGGAGGPNGNVLFGSGGNGGNAGSGGLVTINTTSDSAITTFGQGAAGIEAESVGGNGGEGGDSNSAFYSSGGSGSAGGNGGTVVVNNSATIVTWGAASKGIFAQSVGGGGGDGGSAGAIVGLGGSGSSTSPGGNVTISNSGNITTNSTQSLTSGNNPLFGAGAIFAQSVGGGGGNGGSGAGLFSVGGGGGGGGNGGSVEVDNTAGVLTTHASDSNGIFAQSVGGGGGNGGGAVAVDVSQTTALSLAIGGSGGNGGVGETATVNATGGAIYTYGDRSNGVQVQSVGGGGGNGGFAISASVGALAFSVGIGGAGGGGGAGGTVNMTGGATITTSGNNADGILAQSLGGGGGNGGYAIAAAGGGLAASFAMGGTGGSGGTGGDVTLTNNSTGTILTGGENSAGIFAQSVGGGGGNGGFAVTGDIGAGSAGLAMGGNGSNGGNSGNVTLNNYAGVTTTGNDSDALIAQSMGGGGGNGAFSVQGGASIKGGLGVAIGGNAAGGGNAVGTVTLNNYGTLLTNGNRSAGFFAQSVGGGGGNGGFSVSGNLSAGPDAGAAVGGRGGGGGNGGTVNATNTGQITTTGTQANALQAQSIGGGGGNGGWSVAGDLSAKTGALSIGIGGSGGNGGNGGQVTVNNGTQASAGTIGTYGTYSNGILAQSVGGGGGNGGFSVAGTISTAATVSFAMGGSGGGGGFGSEVDLTSYGNIFTGIDGGGDFSGGILAQSVGGGGGNGGFSVAGGLAAGKNSANIGIAGGGGGGGNGGIVSLGNYGAISTNGYQADGILSQSIGGMGGNGGFSVAGGFTQGGSSVTLSIGGGGGTGGNGGTVGLTNAGSIQTLGDNSDGLSAQSIGGGGGNGGFSVAAAIKGQGNYSGTLSLGGKGGTGGTGGNATVNNTAALIYTTGNQSAGIIAQSIGGGGGNGGFSIGAMGTTGQKNLTLALGGNGGTGGTANTASVTSGSAATSTAITTLGAFSDGILSQSIGGGGGNGGWTVEGMASKGSSLGFSLGGNGGSSNNAGTALVTNYSTISTSGVSSNGIAAQSIGAGGGNGGFNDTANIAASPNQSTGFTAKNMYNYGSGGGAGNGGTVTVNNYAQITTSGANANGILAQSTGGGGGYGGFSYASAILDDLGLGSASDGGGDGGVVTVNNAGSIGTTGDNSSAIIAQSTGGGGGVGGFAISAGLNTEAGAKLGNTTWAMGSNGGLGGNGKAVNVTSSGSVLSTTGANSYGILAQSIGAGGGSGGNATDVGAGVSKYFAGFTLGLGGNAGSSGNGGAVTVVNSSNIGTSGDLSDAILAQSIGGGGGNGGDATSMLGLVGANTTLAIGGNGAGGGTGGTVNVASSNSTIVTSGFASNGIVAESIGGGGGNGGSKTSGLPSDLSLTGSLLAFSLGGNNASSGDGGNASITNSSAIGTTGEFSGDLAALSLAGGGGIATSGVFIAPLTSMTGFGLLGATGGSTPGSAGIASVNNSAQITSSGFGSAAMMAQSLAGGGGIAQSNVALNVTQTTVGGLLFGSSGLTGSVGNSAGASATDSAIAATNGDASDAMLAQSIAAGGGLGLFNIGGSYSSPGLKILEGATTQDLGTAGSAAVTTTANAQLQTLGYNSNAIAAQSITGGGGTGVIEAGSLAASTALSYTLGAQGSSSTPNSNGNGGSVTVTNAAKQIVTNGDLSNGILAQSIAGGGGDAAFKVGGTLSGSTVSGVLGGSHLSNILGGSVSVTNSGIIGTNGNGSIGILAQSIGGGGGFAGFGNLSGTIPNATFTLGGIGDNGAGGGSAQITNSGQIVTTGIGDDALLAQSIGGGGGDGGYNALSLAGTPVLTLLEGQNGGLNTFGGASGASNSALIGTNGVDAFGVAAQSIGGGGGNDVLYATGALTTAASGNQLNMQLGAIGSGSLASGGIVAVTNSNTVNNINDASIGVLGQSIGGGGGSGYFSFNGAFNTGMPKNAIVQLGSASGESGDANTVTMNTSGTVVTGHTPINGHWTGAFATGILGQSIGGGGGEGVMSLELGLPTTTVANGIVTLNLGGHGTGNGNTVTINDVNGSVGTLGSDAQAIAAQSIGGGGGYGAINVFGPAKLSPVPKTPGKYTLNENVGGNGSSGNGGAVNVTQSGGVIQTGGDSSEGILAQSIGGGGGIAGPIHTINEFPATWCSTYGNNCSVHFLGANIAVGGNHSIGNGGAVTVSNSGTITTRGEDASAILAQSIGGGGGLGGDADIIGGPSLTLTSGRTTTVGGTNGATGNGGAVSVTDAGTIATSGDNSSAIIAQSIGGGGGIGGLGMGNVWGTGTTLLGGSGGASGNGGAVNVTVNNANPTKLISTTGNAAFGIFAQSVGGGGGIAGDVSGGISTSVIGKGSKSTATGGAGGDGGAVTVVDNGNIKTTGAGADGIFAQSVGGGGGLTTGYAGSAGAAGSGGAVSVTQNGIVETTGANANAIFAQSAGGTGTGGNVNVTVTGMALAYGSNSDGILAQSIGGAGNGNINITINSGSVVQGGTGSGSAGVKLIGGNVNTIVNNGTITTAGSVNAVPRPLDVALYDTDSGIMGVQSWTHSGIQYQSTSLMTDKTSLLSTMLGSTANSSGVAVSASGGTLNFTNNGNIYGSIALTGTALNFTNGGTYVSGSLVNLGTGTLSLQQGSIMTPGSGGFVASTLILGNFIEETGSDYLVTLDMANGNASALDISGTASLAGDIDLDLLSTNAVAPGAHTDTILSAEGGLTNNGALLTPPKSAVATFNLNYLPNALQLNYDVNYAPTVGRMLNSNDLSFGNYIGAIQTAGSTPALASFMSSVFAVPTIPKLKAFYDRFTPSGSVALGSSALFNNLQFSDEMLRCPSEGVITQAGNCAWARLGAESSHESGSFSSVGFGQNATGFAYGTQHHIGDGATSIGAAIHYTKGGLWDNDSGTSLSGNSLEAGISASRMRHDGILLSADFLAGQGQYKSVRQIGYPAIVTTANGSQAISFIGTHLRAEKRFGTTLRAVTPYLDAGMTHVNVGSLSESGAGLMNENVNAYHAVYPTISSGVRLEDSKLFHGSMLHGSLDLSLTRLVGNPQAMTTATLQGAPAGIAPFAVTNTIDRTQFGIAPALDIMRANKTNIRIGASYNFSQHAHSGGAYVEFRLTP